MMKKLDYQYKISIMDIRKFPKRRSALRPEVPVLLGASDNELKFIKAMGIEHLSLVLKRDELEGDAFHKGMEKFRKNGFIVTNAACMELQKNRAIHLGLENRDEEIEAFIEALKLFSSEGIEFTSVAWQPYGILRTDTILFSSFEYRQNHTLTTDDTAYMPPARKKTNRTRIQSSLSVSWLSPTSAFSSFKKKIRYFAL